MRELLEVLEPLLPRRWPLHHRGPHAGGVEGLELVRCLGTFGRLFKLPNCLTTGGKPSSACSSQRASVRVQTPYLRGTFDSGIGVIISFRETLGREVR